MKQFWNIVLGSFVGVWIALMLFSVLSFFMSFAFIGAMSLLEGKSTATITDNTVLRLDLGCTVDERTTENDLLSILSDEDNSKTGLDEILHAIEVAKTDDRFAGIYIECNGIAAGTASLYEIRNALADFSNESGKFIYAYGDNIAQSDYYLASIADSIFVNTIGAIDLHGMGASVMFFKNALDKIGVEMQIVRVGTFKSAVEPYILNDMSDANRLQYKVLTDNIWGTVVDAIAQSRQIPASRINEMADSLTYLQETQYLIDNHLADAACYEHEFDNKLKLAVHGDTDTEVNFVSPADLVNEGIEDGGNSKIAVIYAVGEIDGSGDGINSAKLSQTILDLADDDDVKGVVLRVNSPGGSAYGSEQIWYALEQIKAAGKPLAVSMGDMAASGGYYISCGANRIFAEPTTLTGSIGVFGVLPCAQELFEDKIGINIDVVKTNENADFPMLTKRMTPAQAAAMQRMVNHTYELFVSRCANGRNMPADSIKAIAEGRVWAGINAMEIGLIDEYGNLDDAISWVASEAGLTDYGISYAPDQEDLFSKYFSKYVSMKTEEKLKAEIGPLYKCHKELTRILSRDNILCLAPEVVTE